MLRLTLLLALSSASLIAADKPVSEKSDSAELLALLSRVESLRNVFAEPTQAPERANVDTIYTALNNTSGAVFGTEGTGCVVLDGLPWRTGEIRVIASPSGKARVELLTVTPASESKPAGAEFRLVDTDQRILVDLRGVEAPIDLSSGRDFKAGWLLGGVLVTSDAVESTRVSAKVNGRECPGSVVAHASEAGLTLVAMTERVAGDVAVARENYRGPAVVVPLRGSAVRVPFEVLNSPPTRDYLVGALVLSLDGEVIGILGKRGLVSADALKLHPTDGARKLTNPFACWVPLITNPRTAKR